MIRARATLLAASTSVLVCACGASATGSATDAAATASSLAPVHAILSMAELRNGRNTAQDEYRRTVETCTAAGWSIKPLSGDQIARLGTGTLEYAFDADHRLSRATRWFWRPASSDPTALCMFEFKTEVAESYVDRTVSGYTGDAQDPGWHERPVEAGELDIRALTDADTSERAATARSDGWTDKGAGGKTGHACRRWQKDSVEMCVWSEGAGWGLASDPVDIAFPPTPDTAPPGIVLSQEPVNGTGIRISTTQFSVGAPLSASQRAPATRKAGT